MSKKDDAEGNFLGRWSRRKQQSKVEDASDPQELLQTEDELPEQGIAVQEADLAEQQIDEVAVVDDTILTDEDMVPIETLNADSDYSPFFSEGVSKQLRNMALKKLFFSGKFAFRDGLDDYDDDFTKFEPLGDTVTSDMKFHQRRKEKARLAKLEEERLAEEKRLAEEAAEDNQEPQEDPTTAETSDQPAEEALEEPTDPREESEHIDTLTELADSSALDVNAPLVKVVPQLAPAVTKGVTPEQKNPDQRLIQSNPSGDESNNHDRENT